MRMWMVDPQVLCRRHLLGEHVELHMLVGHLRRGRRLGELASQGFMEPLRIAERHEVIACEMIRRGYQHRSPLVADAGLLRHLEVAERQATVDVSRSRDDLMDRCKECEERWSGRMSLTGDVNV